MITGADEGYPTSCSKCSINSINIAKNILPACEQCPLSLIANKEGNKCIPCEGGTFSSIEKKCVECPDFTTVSDRSPGCQILDIVHNKAYRMKFKLKGLKRDMEESCEDNNEMCYNKFIGPIRDHKANDIF